MLRKFALLAVCFVALGFLASANQAAGKTRSRVRFTRGTSATTVRGRVAGYKYVDYIIGVRAGQTLSVKLNKSGGAEIVVFTPSGENVEGATGAEYDGEVEFTGDYKIRVLQPRAFARRNNSSNYTLRISIE